MKENKDKEFNLVQEALYGKLPFGKFCKKYNISREKLNELLCKYEYYFVLDSSTQKRSGIIKMHDAAIEFIKLGGYKNTTITTIAKRFGLEHTRLKKYLQKYYKNLQIEKPQYFDEHVFDVIDTEEKAYWLGFLFADGTISSSPLNNKVKTEYKIELSLSSKDLSHLEKFAKFLKYQKEIYCDNRRCRIFLNSKNMWESLNAVGCIPQKTLLLQFPNISKKLIKHFIRGYFDGDGCLTWSNRRHTIPHIEVISTENFLLRILEFLKLEASIRVNSKDYKNDITKKFSLYSHKAFVACYKLYENSNIYLQRKFDIYKEYCRLYWELYKLLQTKNGELWDENTVQSLKDKRFKPVQSVEIEPSIIEE